MGDINRRILVVDDNPAIHQDFKKILGSHNSEEDAFASAENALFGDVQAPNLHVAFHLDFASQGEEALAMVSKASAEGRPYSMAFMDIRMPPGWDGVETTAKIWEVDPRIQIVFCTAYSDYSWEKISLKLKNLHSFVILKKPFEVVEVLQLANAFAAKWNLAEETKLHMRRVQESEQRYQLLTNALPSIVWASRPDGVVDFLNQRSDEYFGEQEHHHARGNEWSKLLHPDDSEKVSNLWKRSLETGETFDVEYRLRRFDGQYRWHVGRAHPLRNADGKIIQWVGTATDIEDQKRAEQALRSTQQDLERRVAERTEALAAERDLLQVLMDNLPDCIYFKDVDSRFTRINKAEAKLLGISDPDAAIGKTEANFLSSRLSRQSLVDERRMFVTGEAMVNVREQMRTAAGQTIWLSSTKVPLRDAGGNFTGLVGVSRDITEQKLFEDKLAYERGLLKVLLEKSADCIYFKDLNSKFLRCSKIMAQRFGLTPEQLVGKCDADLYTDEHANDALEDEQRIIRTGEPLVGKVEQEIEKDGTVRWALTNKMPLRDEEGRIIGTFGVSKDITALKDAETDRQMMELQLRQSQKLEAIGQLAAGIAHEINTPTQYVGDNTRFLKDSFDSIFKVLRAYEELLNGNKANATSPELISRVEASLADADLGYLSEQVPAAIRETLEGIERVTKIVRAMKEFSHPGANDKTPADLNKAIETTATVARNEWKYVANMELELDPTLPLVPCLIGEFNQVILNLIVNAAHAIGDVTKKIPGKKGTITIRTHRDGDHVEIRVSDTGTGIPEIHRPRIFEPFFTTKEVGKGSGQGLAIVYGSVVKKHGGTVTFETEAGKGTTFILRLPILPGSAEKPSIKSTEREAVNTEMNMREPVPQIA